MAKKYIVNVYAEDGIYSKNFSKLENGLKYFEVQSSMKFSLEEIRNKIINNEYFAVRDDWGRSIEITYREVGTCNVCKKCNAALYTISVESKWQLRTPQELRVKEIQRVPVCINCAEDYNFGVWDVIHDNGSHRIIRNSPWY